MSIFTDQMTGWLIVVSLIGLFAFALWMLTRARGRRSSDSAIGTTATRNPHDAGSQGPQK